MDTQHRVTPSQVFLEGGGDECVLMESFAAGIPTATPPYRRWSWRMTRAGLTGAFSAPFHLGVDGSLGCLLHLGTPSCTRHAVLAACRFPLSALRLPCVHMECRRIFFFCMTRRRQRRQRRPGRWHNDSGHPNAACCLLYLPEIYTGLPTRFLSLHTVSLSPNWLGASHLIPFSQ